MSDIRSTTIQTADGPLYVRHGDGARIDYDLGAVEGSIEVAGQVQQIIYVAWNDGMNRARLVDGQRVRILRPVLIPGDKVRVRDDEGFEGAVYERQVFEGRSRLRLPQGTVDVDTDDIERLPPEPTPAPLPLRVTIRRILAENGVDDSNNSPHSWRCFDKVRYPEPCRHIDELVDELAAAVEREGSGND